MPLPVHSPDAPLPSEVVVTETAGTGKTVAGRPSPKLEKTQTFKGSTALRGSKLNPIYEDVKNITVRALVPSSETASKYHQSNVVALIGKTLGPSAWLGQDVNWTWLGPSKRIVENVLVLPKHWARTLDASAVSKERQKRRFFILCLCNAEEKIGAC
jgi:hypothetical protein